MFEDTSKGGSMSTLPTVCPKCQGEMVRGFVADRTDDARFAVSTWVEGPPEKSFWTKTNVPKEKCVPVATFRCASCGYLESYGRPEFGGQ